MNILLVASEVHPSELVFHELLLNNKNVSFALKTLSTKLIETVRVGRIRPAP